jgi:hypothetical protein
MIKGIGSVPMAGRNVKCMPAWLHWSGHVSCLLLVCRLCAMAFCRHGANFVKQLALILTCSNSAGRNSQAAVYMRGKMQANMTQHICIHVVVIYIGLAEVHSSCILFAPVTMIILRDQMRPQHRQRLSKIFLEEAMPCMPDLSVPARSPTHPKSWSCGSMGRLSLAFWRTAIGFICTRIGVM